MSEVWGPLGTPTKEEIQKWWNLPYGQFTELVKDRTRKRKGKLKRELIVYVTKRVYQDYIAEVKVMAFDNRDALAQARSFSFQDTIGNLEYSSIPTKEGTQMFFSTF